MKLKLFCKSIYALMLLAVVPPSLPQTVGTIGVNLDPDGRSSRSAVTVLVFCDFESFPCGRQQPCYEDWLDTTVRCA